MLRSRVVGPGTPCPTSSQVPPRLCRFRQLRRQCQILRHNNRQLRAHLRHRLPPGSRRRLQYFLPNAALQSFNVNSPAIGEWSVHAQEVTPRKLNVAFKHQPVSWTSVKVGFLASARPDLVLGSINAGTFYVDLEFGSLKNASAPVIVTFARPIVNPASSIARAFVTGYTTKSGN